MAKIQDLVKEYLDWLNKSQQIEKKLSALKAQIVEQASAQKIKKIKFGEKQLLIVKTSETRFPQLGEKGRKEVEKIVKDSSEAKEVMVFDIISLGNLYDQKKLSAALLEKLQPYAQQIKSTKIVIRSAKVS